MTPGDLALVATRHEPRRVSGSGLWGWVHEDVIEIGTVWHKPWLSSRFPKPRCSAVISGVDSGWQLVRREVVAGALRMCGHCARHPE